MSLPRLLGLGVLACAAILGVASGVRADYSYQTTPASNIVRPDLTSALFTAGLNSGTGNTATIDLQDISFVAGTAPASFSAPVSFNAFIYQVPPTVASTYAVSGTLNVIYSGGSFSATYPGTATPTSSPELFSLSNITYVSSGSTSGHIFGTIGPASAVPEPASLLMMGGGLLGVVAYALRRRHEATA